VLVALVAGLLANPGASLPFDPRAVRDQVRAAKALERDAATWSVRWRAGEGLSFAPRAGGLTGRALELGRARVSLGGAPLGAASFTERARPHGGGVELDWHFERRPAGRGALTIEVPVSGLAWAGETPRGQHYRDDGTGLHVALGHGTWVDAHGARFDVAAEQLGDRVRYRVSEAVLVRSRFPAVLDPLLTPETGFDTPALDIASSTQNQPAVAFDGSRYLVAWTDGRGTGLWGEVWATLVDTTGALLTPEGIPVATHLDRDDDPEVAYGNGRFLVVWEDEDNGEIYGAFLDATGAILGDPRRPIAIGYGTQAHPDVAWDGTQFVVVFEDNRANNTEIYFTTVGPNGSNSVSGQPVAALAGDQTFPSISCSEVQGQCLITWTDGRAGSTIPTDVYAARWAAGAVLDPTGILVSTLPTTRATQSVSAWGGGLWALAWTEAFTNEVVYATRMAPDGTLLDAADGGLRLSGGTDNEDSPRVAFDGARFLVLWENDDRGGGYALALELDGGTANAPIAAVPWSSATRPALFAGAGPGPFVVWTDSRRTEFDLFASWLSPSLQPTIDGGFPLVLSSAAQTEPRVASDGTDALVVWHSASGSPQVGRIKGALVDGRGALLPGGTVLDFGTPSASRYATSPPDVAYGGGRFAVVWQVTSSFSGAHSVVMRTWSKDAGFLEAGPVFLDDAGSPSEVAPHVAASDSQFLVAWSRTSSLWARRYPYAGTADPAPIPIPSVASATNSIKEVDSLGTDFAVIWTQDIGNSRELKVGRVLASGATPDADGGVQLAPGSYAYDPALSCGGGRCLTAYESAGNLWMQAFDATLTPTTPLPQPLSMAGRSQQRPALAWLGSEWLALWEDERSGEKREVWSTRVRADLSRAPPEGVVLTSGAQPLLAPTAASAGPGQVVLAWQTVDLSPGVRSWRVRARALLELANGTACAQAAECTSGFCVDGVCCDSACGGGARDCQACSAGQGAPTSGTCAVLSASTTCRAAVSVCDLAETCDGAATTCPADLFQPDSAVCNIDGACSQGVCIGGTPPTFGFVSTPTVFLTCSEAVKYSGAGAPEVNGPGPVTYSLSPLPGESLPEGLSVDPATGVLDWSPTNQQAGRFRAVLVARGDGWAAAQNLDFEIECEPRVTKVGCGCQGGPGDAALAALGLASLLARRRRLTR
jgi:MYXO-CTERM domain-containing protein